MLKMNVDRMKACIRESNDFLTAGRLDRFDGIIRASLSAKVGELCKVISESDSTLAEVIGFDGEQAILMPLRNLEGVSCDSRVIGLGRILKIPVGYQLMGRTIGALGNPIDEQGPLICQNWITPEVDSPAPLERPDITDRFETGQRAIDGLLTMGKGQRIGLFAGSGVGKSTLIGEIARKSSADINVVALVGERGREVRPFIEESLGEEGLKRSIVVVATGNEPALVRIRAVKTAIAISSWFRNQGKDVLLMVDSLTRLAIAQRELGLLLGEPPTAGGFPPSALQLITDLMEPLGCNRHGSITGLMSVLVSGDDTNEPVADTARGVLDGHITLDRKLAESNHYPAIDVSQSISRLFDNVVDPEHLRSAANIRNILATYEQVADLVRIGIYQQGSSEKIDAAILLRENVLKFLRQRPGEYSSYSETLQMLLQIGQAWNYS
ncbi:MAG: FliI/YscN family ATPase [Planctomycetota bacterium]|nr:FliI/YscN family ATPase [Planctomycetota bacterium]